MWGVCGGGWVGGWGWGSLQDPHTGGSLLHRRWHLTALLFAALPCRSSIPVVTCLLAIPVERRRPTRHEALALGVLTAGVMLAVWQGRVAGAPHAILLCLPSTVCSGAMMTLIGRLLT